MYETIKFTKHADGSAELKLNRPARHNAFDAAVIAELTEAFERLHTDKQTRLLFLTAEGKSFSAGADLAWMRQAASYCEAENIADARALADMLHLLYTLPQASIACVQGAAIGGGAGLVAASDIVIAMTSATFCFSEVKLGLTPATISPYVIQAIGPRWAKALFITAESFAAGYAEKMGLVHYSAETDADFEMLKDYVKGLVLAGAPGAVTDCKRLIEEVQTRPIDSTLADLTAKRIAERRASLEGREGLAAFLDKRPPDWAPSKA